MYLVQVPLSLFLMVAKSFDKHHEYYDNATMLSIYLVPNSLCLLFLAAIRQQSLKNKYTVRMCGSSESWKDLPGLVVGQLPLHLLHPAGLQH
jgi:hypothetical protein